METLQNQNVLLFTRTMGLGGTENVVLQLCEILNPVVNKVVVCSCGGVNEKRLQTMGIKHYTIPDIEKKDLKTIFSTLSQVKKIVKKSGDSKSAVVGSQGQRVRRVCLHPFTVCRKAVFSPHVGHAKWV